LNGAELLVDRQRARSIQRATITPQERSANEAVTRRAQRYQRRQIVAALHLTRQYSIEQICEKLNEDGVSCTYAMVFNDINQMKRMWQEQAALTDINAWIEFEVSKLDGLESVLIGNFRSANISPTEYCASMIKVAERRAKLLGLDQPTKIKIDARSDNVSTLTDAEIDAVIRADLHSLAHLIKPPQLANGHSNGHATTIDAGVR
jgi:hypothetical protein